MFPIRFAMRAAAFGRELIRVRRELDLDRGCVRSISRSAWVGSESRAFIDRCGWSATQPRSSLTHF